MAELNKVKVVYDHPFFKVKVNPGGWYHYGERKGVDSVAFILFDKSEENTKYCLTRETKPPLDEFSEDGEVFVTTAFGGSQDEIGSAEYIELPEDKKLSLMKSISIKECAEEAGYKVPEESSIFLGKVLLSTQMNQYVYCFAFDVTGIEFTGRDPQDRGEEKAELVWGDRKFIVESECMKARAILISLENVTAMTKTSGRVPVPDLQSTVDKLTSQRHALVVQGHDDSDYKYIYDFIEDLLEILGYVTEFDSSDDLYLEDEDKFDLVVYFSFNPENLDDKGLEINPSDTKDSIKAKILRKEYTSFTK